MGYRTSYTSIVLLSLFATQTSFAEPPPDNIFGKYIGGYQCPPYDEKAEHCINTQTKEYVIISKAKNADAHVKLQMYFDKGHTCSLDEDVKWQDGRLVYEAEGYVPEKPCHLEFQFRETNELVLKDSKYICRKKHCGTRGQLDGSHFKKAKKSEKSNKSK